MTPDGELLRVYAATGDEAAFAELVRRHLPLVYGAALRVLNGDAAMAQDVAQSVFTDLARKAAELRQHPTLAGWLHTSARFQAGKSVRTEQRRRAREGEASAMNEANTTPEVPWEELRPLLDDAIAQLSDDDRDAVLLRYFENKSFAEVGAILGLETSAAHKRVSRAVDKLREAFARAGITTSAALLTTSLSSQAATTVPDGLAATVAGTAVAGASGLKAASLAATVAKGAAATKATGLLGIISALIGPLTGVFAGFLGARSGLKQAFSASQGGEPAAPAKALSAEAREEWKTRRQAWTEKRTARRQAKQEEIKLLLTGWRLVLIKPCAVFMLTLTLLLAFGLAIPDKKGEDPFFDNHRWLMGGILCVLIGLTFWSLIGVIKASRVFHKNYRKPFEEHRRRTDPLYRRRLAAAPIMLGILGVIIYLPLHYLQSNPALGTAVVVGLIFGFGLVATSLKKLIKWTEPEMVEPVPKSVRQPREFRSPKTLLGLPLVHVNFTRTPDGRKGLAKGWLAIGSRAVGVVAIGGTAVGAVSIGPAAGGLVAIGGISLAPVAIGCVALGHWAAGGVAVGTFATGGIALATEAASGALATAHNIASGDLAYATHANDATAQAVVNGGAFFTNIRHALQSAWVAIGLLGIAFLMMVSFVAMAKKTSSAKKRSSAKAASAAGPEKSPPAFATRTALLALVVCTAGAFGVLYLWDRLAENPAFPLPLSLQIFLLCFFFLFSCFSLIFFTALIANAPWSYSSKKIPDEENAAEPEATALDAREPATVQKSPDTPAKPAISKAKIVLGLLLLAGLIFVIYLRLRDEAGDFGSDAAISWALGMVQSTEIMSVLRNAIGRKWKALAAATLKLAGGLALWCLLWMVIAAYWKIALPAYVAVLVILRSGVAAKLGLGSLGWWRFILTATSMTAMLLVLTPPNFDAGTHPALLFGALAAYFGNRSLFYDKYPWIANEAAATAQATPLE